MANTINEARTPAELAAWLRQWADGADASDYLDDNDARQLACAIERVCAPGNAAAMREALTKARLYFDHRGEGTNFDDAGMAIDAITSIYVALAAPARNCDRFATVGAAHRAWRATDQERDFVRWLFAPAEGGAEK